MKLKHPLALHHRSQVNLHALPRDKRLSHGQPGHVRVVVPKPIPTATHRVISTQTQQVFSALPSRRPRSSRNFSTFPDSPPEKANTANPIRPPPIPKGEGQDPSDIDPHHGDPTGDLLVHRMGELAVGQQKRRKWIYDPEKQERVTSPSVEDWCKYHGPPGEPAVLYADITEQEAQLSDSFKVDSDLDSDPGRDQWCRDAKRHEHEWVSLRLDLESRSLFTQDNDDDSGFVPSDDPMYYDVWHDARSGWERVQRYYRLMYIAQLNKTADNEKHEEAFGREAGEWERMLRVQEDEEGRGVVLSELEKERRKWRFAADSAANDIDWELMKIEEMEVWREMERLGVKAKERG